MQFVLQLTHSPDHVPLFHSFIVAVVIVAAAVVAVIATAIGRRNGPSQ